MKRCLALLSGVIMASLVPCASAQTAVTPAPPALVALQQQIAASADSAGPQTVRWQEGAQDSRQFLFQGHRVKVLLADGIAVVAYLKSADDPLGIQVWFLNQSDRAFDVLPERFSLEVLRPQARTLAYVSPRQIKKRIDDAATGAALAEVLSSVSRAFAGTSSTSTAGAFRGTDSEGRRSSGTYNGVATTYDSSANTQQTAANLSLIKASAEDQKASALTGVILANTVFSGQEYGGTVNFKRDKRATLMLLRVPVGDLVLEFPFERMTK